MRRRVFGIETEYGIMGASPGGEGAHMEAEEAARRLFEPLIQLGRSSNLFLRNGGRLYLDVGAHPEYATAECDHIEDLLAQDRAGQKILADLAVKADSVLEKEGREERIYLFRNNLDAQGNSFGCHENYLLHRRRDFREVADALVAYFITRQIITGAGNILLYSGDAKFTFSQRAEQMWDAVSSATTRSRPIINTRDEPLADSASFRRMHVIVGDTNVAEPTTALKICATELLLTAIEDGLRISDMALHDPMAAIRSINRDLTGAEKIDLADGRSMSPVHIQREIRSRVLDHIDLSSLSKIHHYLIDLWGRGLDAIESGDWSAVDTELDIAIKRKLLMRYSKKISAPLSDPRIARLALSYHDITSSGLLNKLERGRLVKRLTTSTQVDAAVTAPPATTRAHLRGRIIAAAEDTRRDLGVDWVHVRLEDQGDLLSLQDPLSYEDSRVDDFIESIYGSSPTIPA